MGVRLPLRWRTVGGAATGPDSHSVMLARWHLSWMQQARSVAVRDRNGGSASCTAETGLTGKTARRSEAACAPAWRRLTIADFPRPGKPHP